MSLQDQRKTLAGLPLTGPTSQATELMALEATGTDEVTRPELDYRGKNFGQFEPS